MDFTLITGFIIPAACLLYAAYQGINIMRSEPVDAVVVGYEKENHVDPEFGTDTTSISAVYQYEYNGWRKTYRSRFGREIPFLHKGGHHLYVRADGKVFEKEGVFVPFVAAVIVLVLSRI